jgi:regulation of enolase protein 1 (concanavalin A-like superfamily)
VNPQNDGSFSLNGSSILLSVPSGISHDVWTNGDESVRIMQSIADADFEVEAKFSSVVDVNTMYQEEGIIVEQDAGTFLRFSVHSAYEQTNVFVATIFGASATINVNQGIRGGAAIWMRVKRTGSNWSFTYSYDSIHWTPAFTFSQTMQVARIGPYVGNSGAPAPAFTAIVDHWVNRASPPSLIDGSSYPPAPAPPVINVWYGDTQTFGQVGVPQQWVNVLGDVSDFNEVNTLTYSLNGGTPQPLWMGENIRRLVAPGNFNVEIDYASLNPGANTVTITATDNNGLQSSHSVTVNYVAGQSWPLPYTINWSTASSIQSVAQIVDGIWAIQSDGTVRTLQTGYDRILDLGDRNAWQNYVATAEVTMNGVNPNGFAVGFVVGWQGHTTVQYGQVLPDQPRTGHPFPGAGIYGGGLGPEGVMIYENTVGNPETIIVQDTTGRTLNLGVKYVFKFQVQNNSSGGSHYSFKIWPASGAEPANWDLQGDGELGLGSVILLAHECDVSFGTVTVTGL